MPPLPQVNGGLRDKLSFGCGILPADKGRMNDVRFGDAIILAERPRPGFLVLENPPLDYRLRLQQPPA